MLSLLGLLVIGIIAGYLARLLVPGRDPMGFFATMLLGVAGSFVGGFLWSLLTGGGLRLLATRNLIGAVIGAIVALLIYRQIATRSA